MSINSAKELIRTYGLSQAKKLLGMIKAANVPTDMQITVINGMWHKTASGFTCRELEQLIESHDLVDSFNGVVMAQRFVDENIPCEDSIRWEKAIADVRSCQ